MRSRDFYGLRTNNNNISINSNSNMNLPNESRFDEQSNESNATMMEGGSYSPRTGGGGGNQGSSIGTDMQSKKVKFEESAVKKSEDGNKDSSGNGFNKDGITSMLKNGASLRVMQTTEVKSSGSKDEVATPMQYM